MSKSVTGPGRQRPTKTIQQLKRAGYTLPFRTGMSKRQRRAMASAPSSKRRIKKEEIKPRRARTSTSDSYHSDTSGLGHTRPITVRSTAALKSYFQDVQEIASYLAFQCAQQSDCNRSYSGPEFNRGQVHDNGGIVIEADENNCPVALWTSLGRLPIFEGRSPYVSGVMRTAKIELNLEEIPNRSMENIVHNDDHSYYMVRQSKTGKPIPRAQASKFDEMIDSTTARNLWSEVHPDQRDAY